MGSAVEGVRTRRRVLIYVVKNGQCFAATNGVSLVLEPFPRIKVVVPPGRDGKVVLFGRRGVSFFYALMSAARSGRIDLGTELSDVMEVFAEESEDGLVIRGTLAKVLFVCGLVEREEVFKSGFSEEGDFLIVLRRAGEKVVRGVIVPLREGCDLSPVRYLVVESSSRNLREVVTLTTPKHLVRASESTLGKFVPSLALMVGVRRGREIRVDLDREGSYVAIP